MKSKQIFDFIENEIFGKDLLDSAQTLDSNANGIQISSQRNINKIAIGVSCNQEFLDKAIAWGADCCMFHHGLSLSEKYGIYNSRLSLPLQKELSLIFKNDLTISAYHYCLDTDLQIGNNISIAQKLNLKFTGEKYFSDWGIITEFETEKNLQEFAQDCSTLFKHDIFIVSGNHEMIKRVGICSGGALPNVKDNFEIISKNIDLHLTGVVTENGVSFAKESGYSYFACGHYATEVFGIEALGEKINEKFPELDIRFIEVWNEM